MNYELRFTPISDEIVKLRKISFGKLMINGVVDLKGLEWNTTDSRSLHLSLYKKNQLVSCLRLSVFSSRENFFNSALYPLPDDEQAPFVLLARAATDPSCAGLGLHSLLRLRAFEIILNKGLENILGTMAESSQRIKQLTDLGYKVIGQSPGWENSFLKPDGDVLLMQLKGRDKIQIAINKLLEKYKLQKLDHYPENLTLI